MTDYSAGSRGDDLAIDETARLIASNKVEGTPVYDGQGAHLGSIYNLMIDKHTGEVAYAVMSFGGFLRIGERYHPIPWKKLNYDTRQGGYIADVDRTQLEGAPTYGPGEDPWTDPAYGRSIYSYYGVPYYGWALTGARV